MQWDRLLAANATLFGRRRLQRLQRLDRGARQLQRIRSAGRGSLDALARERLHQHIGPAIDHRLGRHRDDARHGKALRVERLHDATLTGDVGGTGDPRSRWREPQDGAPAAELDPVSEAGVAFRNRLQLEHALADRAGQVVANLRIDSAHRASRCDTSKSVPTARRSPRARTMLTPVKGGYSRSDPGVRRSTAARELRFAYPVT